MASKTLYILYNADGTLIGKLRYGYRKLSSAGPESACAACDITHGGLSLSESPRWVDVKQQIEKQHVKVVQWHRDEIDAQMKAFVQETSLKYPAVVLDDGGGKLNVLMDRAELNACGGDPDKLLNKLVDRKVVAGQSTIGSNL